MPVNGGGMRQLQPACRAKGPKPPKAMLLDGSRSGRHCRIVIGGNKIVTCGNISSDHTLSLATNPFTLLTLSRAEASMILMAWCDPLQPDPRGCSRRPRDGGGSTDPAGVRPGQSGVSARIIGAAS